jgi:hypothetical protein
MADSSRYLEILLPDEEPFRAYRCGNPNALFPLSLVNIFVGVNNSGKSRLLRALFTIREFSYTATEYKADPFYKLISDIRPPFDNIFAPYNVAAAVGIPSDFLDTVLKLDSHFVSNKKPIHEITKSTLERISKAEGGGISYARAGGGGDPDARDIREKLRRLGHDTLERLSHIKFNPDVGDVKRYYVPILRGMRPLDNSQTNYYKQRTTEDYFGNPNIPDNGTVYTGIELYQTLKAKLLGEPDDRDLVRHFEEFLSKQFFNFRTITLIPREGKNTVHIKIGNEKQLPIYSLGDGMQGLIICLFNIFTEKDRSLFFIEEPDVCMHPSLQRSFIEALLEIERHQYFITSHSNHLLDMTLGVIVLCIRFDGISPEPE